MDSEDRFSSRVFTSYLTNRTQFVDLNGTFSTIRHLGVGQVPQGSVLGPLLYLLYTSPVADIIRRHNLNFHFYDDDSQLFLSFKGADRLFDSKLQLEACVNDICQWMVFSELKLNRDKNELLIIHSRCCFRPSLSCLRVGAVKGKTPAMLIIRLAYFFAIKLLFFSITIKSKLYQNDRPPNIYLKNTAAV